MTIGDKIQYYRKQKGLSQEELGQLLTVSRQTVSQWETGQTSPTVDNLVRLKEVLGISVDELLSPEMGIQAKVPSETIKEEPLERYETRMNASEAKDFIDWFTAGAKRVRISRMIMDLLCIAVLFLFFGVSLGEISLAVGFSLGMVFYEIYLSVQHRKYLVEAGKTELWLTTQTYVFSLYEDHIVRSTESEERETATMRLEYSDLQKAQEHGDFCIFFHGEKRLLIRKSLVAPGSRMDSLLQNGLQAGEKAYFNRKEHVLHLLFGDLCGLSLMAMICFVCYPYTIYLKPWITAVIALVMVLFPAIQLYSLVHFIRRGKEKLKSILAVSICAFALVIVFGVYGYCQSVDYYQSPEQKAMATALAYLEEVEQLTELDFPVPVDAALDFLVPSAETFYISKLSVYKFKSSALDALLQVQKNGKAIWGGAEAVLKEDAFSYFYIGDDFMDRSAYYNLSTQQWNTFTGSGSYLLFYCDHDESAVFIYVVDLPEGQEIEG